MRRQGIASRVMKGANWYQSPILTVPAGEPIWVGLWRRIDFGAGPNQRVSSMPWLFEVGIQNASATQAADIGLGFGNGSGSVAGTAIGGSVARERDASLTTLDGTFNWFYDTPASMTGLALPLYRRGVLPAQIGADLTWEFWEAPIEYGDYAGSSDPTTQTAHSLILWNYTGATISVLAHVVLKDQT